MKGSETPSCASLKGTALEHMHEDGNRDPKHGNKGSKDELYDDRVVETRNLLRMVNTIGGEA